MKADTRPVRPLRPAWQYALGVLTSACLVVLLGIALLGSDGWRQLGPFAWALLLPGLALALLGGSWAAAQWMSPTGRANLYVAAAGYLLGVTGILAAGERGGFSPVSTLACFSIAAAFAAASAAGGWLLLRQAYALRRKQIALATGLLAGSVGFLVVQVHCANSELRHMLLGHGLVPLAWGVLAYYSACFAGRNR
jgi:hypothetical protein